MSCSSQRSAALGERKYSRVRRLACALAVSPAHIGLGRTIVPTTSRAATWQSYRPLCAPAPFVFARVLTCSCLFLLSYGLVSRAIGSTPGVRPEKRGGVSFRLRLAWGSRREGEARRAPPDGGVADPIRASPSSQSRGVPRADLRPEAPVPRASAFTPPRCLGSGLLLPPCLARLPAGVRRFPSPTPARLLGGVLYFLSGRA